MHKPTKALTISRKFHRWLMLFIGIQFVIWSITGAYMVIFDIDYIHGDSMVINHQTTIDNNEVNYSLAELFNQYPDAKNLVIGKLIDKDVYRFVQEKKKYLVDANTGKLLSPIDEALAIKLAKHHYSGDDLVRSSELITENPPFELSPRRLPAWRINFDSFGSPAIYISSETGNLVGKRHEYWRTFDLFFRLHVMDYEDGEDIKNYLLFFVVIFGIAACLSGLVLVYFRVFKKNFKGGAV